MACDHLQEHSRLAHQELSRLWMYRPETREEVEGYFTMLGDPNWKLQSANKNYEVWRLPGEDLGRIMG